MKEYQPGELEKIVLLMKGVLSGDNSGVVIKEALDFNIQTRLGLSSEISDTASGF